MFYSGWMYLPRWSNPTDMVAITFRLLAASITGKSTLSVKRQRTPSMSVTFSKQGVKLLLTLSMFNLNTYPLNLDEVSPSHLSSTSPRRRPPASALHHQEKIPCIEWQILCSSSREFWWRRKVCFERWAVIEDRLALTLSRARESYLDMYWKLIYYRILYYPLNGPNVQVVLLF